MAIWKYAAHLRGAPALGAPIWRRCVGAPIWRTLARCQNFVPPKFKKIKKIGAVKMRQKFGAPKFVRGPKPRFREGPRGQTGSAGTKKFRLGFENTT